MSWTADETAYLLQHYRTKTLRQIAAHLGKRREVVISMFGRHVQAGRADRRLRFYSPRWTPEELVSVRAMLRDGWPLARIAKAKGRSVWAIKCALKRRGVRRICTLTAVGTLSLEDVSRVMGLPNPSSAVRRWLGTGLLLGSRCNGSGKGRRWIIRPGDLVDFLQQHPEQYDYARIPLHLGGALNPWKTYAARVDATAGHYALKEAARALGISTAAVRERRRRGTLLAVHLPGQHAQSWWVPRSEVARLRGERRAA